MEQEIPQFSVEQLNQGTFLASNMEGVSNICPPKFQNPYEANADSLTESKIYFSLTLHASLQLALDIQSRIKTQGIASIWHTTLL